MILSRTNLLAVKMTKTDKDIPALDTLHIRKDGGTIGTNGMAVVAISPVMPEMLKHSLLKDEPLESDTSISSDSVSEILKNIPKDTKFSGVTELCSVKKKNGRVKFGLHDGKRKKSIEAKQFNGSYVQYLDVFERAYNTSTIIKTATNLKRLITVLKCIDDICSDSSKECPVFLQFTEQGNIIIRAKNPKNGQHVISIMKAYDGIEGHFPEYSDFEKSLFKSKEVRKVRKVKRK